MKFYDTNILLDAAREIFENNETFYISNISLLELESIKRSATKDESVKYAARCVIHLLNDNPDKYSVINYITSYDDILKEYYLPQHADSQIIISAYVVSIMHPDLVFVTNDLACKILAESVGLNTECLLTKKDEYKGYIEIDFNDFELNDFYNHILPENENLFNLYENQYLLIKYRGKIEDKYKWAGSRYIKVPYYKIESKMFGKITPKDDYQQIAMDSLFTNQLTVMRGKAGSGKSYLGLSYLFSLLEKGKIDSIIIFCNTVAVRGAAKLGFYPGSKDEKLLDSQIGNFLATKFGSITEVEKMIDEGIIMLIPTSDMRGIDLTGMNCGVFCTESQNTSVDMMKLMLQRIGEDSVCVFEGDDRSQVDMKEYAGKNNGLRRLSEVFRGHDLYGEVNLPNIHRSKIAALAEDM